MANVSPFLWFEGNMQEAVKFYASVFKDARIVSMSPAMATFELLGQKFLALNAHPHDKFNDAISFFIECDTQADVDYYWEKLADGGGERQCGWVKDRFGLSWQVIPNALGRYLMDKDRDKANRVMQAMLKMKKIVIADLDAAANG
ncbi:MAG TPA: VOC family protein [Gammaproteobacteria bacterium]|nr:VOC family protein [Gammaproteobacteria bacterium]